MWTNKILRVFSLIGLVFSLSLPLYAQYTMNSPYSRFGLGDIEPIGLVTNRSMGGIGIAYWSENQINYQNPASYTALDSQAFVWDIGTKGAFSKYSTQSSSYLQKNFNFDHFSLGFSIKKNKIYLSAGLMPYSKIGYNFFEYKTFDDGEKLKSNYYGSGNINRFYVGNAFSFWNKSISIGYNLSFLFGSYNNSTYVAMINSKDEQYGIYTQSINDNSINGVLLNTGVQGKIKISPSSSLIIGSIIDFPTHLNANRKKSLQRGTETLSYTDDTGKIYIPLKYGIGIQYYLNNKFSYGIDAVIQNWQNAKFYGSKDSLQQYSRISMGAEYVHDKNSFTSYIAKIRFRAGLYYENSYVKLYNTGITDYGFSFGMAFPLRRSHSFLNVGTEIGKRATNKNNLISDNYLKFYLSINLYDIWFVKRKYN